MSPKWIRIAVCFVAIAPSGSRAAECALNEIAKRAQLAAAAATSAGQEQSSKLAAEAQRITAAPKTMLNIAPEAQMSEHAKSRLAELKMQIGYWRLHQHYIAQARTIEAEVAQTAEAARLLQRGAAVTENEQKHVDALHFLRQNFPNPKTGLGAIDAASACDLPHALRALEHAAADELNAIPLREQSARIQSLARKYALDMSRSAWSDSQAWLDAIPSLAERQKAKEDMALILRARLEVALINDLQNLAKLYAFSQKRFGIFESELARLVQEQSLEHVGEAWSAYVASAPPEEKKLNALLDFMESGNKLGASERTDAGAP